MTLWVNALAPADFDIARDVTLEIVRTVTWWPSIAEFNRAELMIAPALQTEGKLLQSSQGVGMGSRGAAAEVNMPSGDTESHAPAASATVLA